MHIPSLAVTGRRSRSLPAHGLLGICLVAVAWPASWLHLGLLGEYSFFPLWLGFILTIDALVLRRNGSSLLSRGSVPFLGMFLVSVPLWWIFEGVNQFTESWHYSGADDYSPLRYVLVASWHFSVVIPAVLESTELLGSFRLLERLNQGPRLAPSSRFLAGIMALGSVSFAALFLWPEYAFPLTWISLFLLMDPINYLQGRPSIIGDLRRGDWRLLIALAAGALLCGWFWEMWNYWAFPKWYYTIDNVDFAHIFEMPLLGYAGYPVFGLEVYSAYHFLTGLVARFPKVQLQISGVEPELPSGGAVVSRTVPVGAPMEG